MRHLIIIFDPRMIETLSQINILADRHHVSAGNRNILDIFQVDIFVTVNPYLRLVNILGSNLSNLNLYIDRQSFQ